MTDSIWTAPTAARPGAEAGRRRIMAQHLRLRELLTKARTVADAALEGQSAVPDAVASAIGDIRAAFEVHLDFEERVWPTLFVIDSLQLLARTERMRGEHQRQRAILSTLHREAKAVPELPTLAAKLAFLVDWLLTDMAGEERELLASSAEPAPSPG